MTAAYPRCGSFVLLRELARDAFGPLFRAGHVHGEAIDGLVLLRQLAVGDPVTVVAAATERRQLAVEVRSPFLGELRDVGSCDGVPFVAYEYRPGLTAAQLLALADDRMSPLAPELAVVIADRAAQALLAVWGAGSGPGLLVPDLLWVSTEGEVQLLAAEAAPALRQAASGLAALAPFLAPEARAGEPSGEADDVWSLGALLAALLTGHAPPDGPDADGKWLAELTLAEDDAHIPEPLVELLGRSLVPRAQRLARVDAWQKALARCVEMLDWRASPFQLAVYMHGLCKAEMAREPREVEREREEALRQRQAPQAPVAPVAVTAAPAPLEAQTPSEDTGTGPVAASPPVRSRYLPAVAAAVVVLAVAGGWWAWRGRGDTSVDAASAPAPTSQAAPVAAELPPVATPTVAADELEKRLTALLAEHEQSLNQRYSKEIDQLRAQLTDTRRQEAAPPPAPRREEPPRTRDPAPVPAASPPGAAAPAGAEPRPETLPSTPAAAAPPAAAPVATQEPPAAEAPLVAARLLQFDPPAYPLLARRQRVEGTVVLSLRIDPAGSVGDVRFLRRVAQDVGINEAAAAAARNARFAPATRGGVAVESWYTLTIPFQL